MLTKFNWQDAAKAIAAVRAGHNETAIAALLHCTPRSLSRWKRQYPQFGIQMKRASIDRQLDELHAMTVAAQSTTTHQRYTRRDR